jgi:hypothetical protein
MTKWIAALTCDEIILLQEMLTCEEIESRIQNLSQEKFWLILMTGGGHFAGAVFSG